jgi:hypothetical protein
MGARGPAPKRSTERHGHRAKDDVPEQVEQAGEVEIPEPEGTWHPTAAAWYASLEWSAQSRFYEPSDWQNAHYCAGLMSLTLTEEKVNAQLVSQVRGLMTDLLVTEGARRRVGLEVVRKPAEAQQQSAGNVTKMADRRKRVADAS